MPCVKQAQACATALAVSWEEAQHSSLPRVHVPPRWLWSAPALQKGAAPANGLPSSVCDCRATCQLRLRPPTRSWVPRVKHARERNCVRCLLGGGAAREFVDRAQRRAGCGGRRPYKRALHRRKACLLRRVAVVRSVSCQRAAGCRDAVCEVSEVMRNCARCVLGGRVAAFKLVACARPSVLIVALSTLQKRAGPAEGLPSSVCDCGATC